MVPRINKRTSLDHAPPRSHKIKWPGPGPSSKTTSTSIEISSLHAAAPVFKIVSLRRPALTKQPTLPPSKIAPTSTTSTREIPSISDVTYLQTLFDKVKSDPFLIAHDKSLQHVLDSHKVPWGVQYELYRGIQAKKWTVDEAMKKVAEFKGASDGEMMYRVENILKGVPLPKNASDLIGYVLCFAPSGLNRIMISRELAREQAAIIENAGRGLGLMGRWEKSHEENWYGGQIQQIVRLRKDGDEYRLEIQPMERKKSNRLARYLSSRRIIRLKCSEDLLKQERDQIIRFLSRSFILAGRIFVPIPPKDDSLHLIEVRQDYERSEQTWCGDQYRLSYSQFVDWHNPLGSNNGQVPQIIVV